MSTKPASSATYKTIAKRYGTPVYAYDAASIRTKCRELTAAFPNAEFHYACKANANPAVMKIIREEGIGMETVSGGELDLAEKTGFKKTQISFTCSNLTGKELQRAAKSAGHVHLDSLHQIELWGSQKLGKNISLRLNQGIGAGHHDHVITGGPDSKFGISLADVPKAKKLAAKYGLRITGLAQHIGSCVLDHKIFIRSIDVLLNTAKGFPEVNHIDFGGGFGIPYAPHQKPLDLQKLSAAYKKHTEVFAKTRKFPVTFAFEPGRFLVADAGTLLVSVVDMKSTSAHLFAGVDSGFNHLIRPAMYGSHHPIENLSRSRGTKKKVTIAGNVCESGDLFAIKRDMVVPKLGDILAIKKAGAYGMSMASNYNQRPLPPEVLI